MIGLFGALELGQRSLQAQQQGVEVAGHNLANVNNPAYARQRLRIQTSVPVQVGPQIVGTGAQATAVVQLRNQFVDRQVQSEASITGYLEARQSILELAQANLGQVIDTQTSDPESATAAQGVGSQNGLAEGLSDLFNSFQSLASKPADPTERLILLQNAQGLAATFRRTDQRLAGLRNSLNEDLADSVEQVNDLLAGIARLNLDVARAESGGGGAANDLRDARLEKLEALAEFVNFGGAESENGMVDVSVGGVLLVDGGQMADTLETYDAGNGQVLLRSRQTGAPLTLTSGSLQGAIATRDEDVAVLQAEVDKLASLLIAQVNIVHQGGFGLSGTTGEDFFTGAGAGDIAVNAALLADVGKVQAAGVAGASGDNAVALALAQLGSQPQASFNQLTFSQSYGQTVAKLGQALSAANAQSADQKVLTDMLQRQREAASGVSLDEEMTELVKYQRAYQASARLISTIDQMFDEVMNLKR